MGIFNGIHRTCFFDTSQVEDYDINEELYPKEMLHLIALNETKRKKKYFEFASGDVAAGNKSIGLGALLGSIKGEIEKTGYKLTEAEESISTLQKLYVENLKLRRILGLGKCSLDIC